MAKLKGKNQIRKFRQVAERLVSEISSLEGVTGIVFSGSLVRGFADRFSDIDIMVFLSKNDEPLRMQIRNIGLNEEKHSGIETDLMIHFLKDFKREKWDEIDKWSSLKLRLFLTLKGKLRRFIWRS